MVIRGVTLNDILESQGDGRPLDDDERYVMMYGGKIVKASEYKEKMRELFEDVDLEEMAKGSAFNAAMEAEEKKDESD